MKIYNLVFAASVSMLLATALPSSAFATSPQLPAASSEFGFEELKSLISSRDLRSVEQVMPLLPRELRENFVLMNQSRSLQSGTPEFPRAMLFNRDASLVMSFTEDPGRRGPERFEIITFDQKTARFTPKAIVFSGGAQPAAVIEAPGNCFGCHGRVDGDLHPVWDPGLVWRGAYGSHDDQLKSQPEAEAYAKFVTGAARQGAYQYLDWSKKIGEGSRSEVENRPNLRIGLLMMRQQAKRIARQLDAGDTALYVTRLKTLAGCAEHTPPKNLKSVVETALVRFLTPLFGSEFARTFLATDATSIEDVLDVVNQAGLSVDEVPLTIEKRTFAVFDGSFAFKDLLIAEMAKRIGLKGLSYRALTESELQLSESPGSIDIDQLGEPLTVESQLKLCRL